MKSYLVTLTIVIAAAAAFGQPAQKTFNVNPGGRLEMNVNFGDIRIEVKSGKEVIVSSDEGWSGNDRISQSGNNIKIVSDYPRDYKISIPSEFSVNVTSTGGDFMVNGTLNGDLSIVTAAGSVGFHDVNGSVTANTGGGDIKGGNIKGKVSLNTAGGDISVQNTDGELVMNSAGGDIRVSKVTKTATINTGGGNVEMGTLEYKSSIRTGGGDIKINSAGNGVSVSTGGGQVMINDSKGDIGLITGGGDVVVNSKSGNIKIKTGAGNVYADIVPGSSGENSIITGFGDVKVFLPENSNTTVRIITKEKHREDVHIVSDFSLTTEDVKEDATYSVYKINGGGSIIEIKTGNGNVELRKKR